MALTQLAPPYPVFTDKNGDPLDNGYLYFGEANKNPETNPIQVYYDSAFTQPAAQPLRTSNGYVMRNGSPALIYASSQFSVTVRDKNNALVIYSPVGYGIDPGSISGTVVYDDFTGDGSTVNFTLSASPSTKNATNVYIDGVYQSKDNYSTAGSTLTFTTAPPLNSAIEVVSQESSIIGGAGSQQITYTQGGAGSVTRTVQSRLRDFVSVKDFGAVGDGVTDDTVAVQAAINNFKIDAKPILMDGNFRITAPLVYQTQGSSSGLRLVGTGIENSSIIGDFTGSTLIEIDGSSLQAGRFQYGGGFSDLVLTTASGAVIENGITTNGWWWANHVNIRIGNLNAPSFTKNGIFIPLRTDIDANPDFYASIAWQLDNCQIDSMGEYGIYGANNTGYAGWIINRGQYIRCGLDGLYVNTNGWRVVMASPAYNGRYGINFTGSPGVTLTNGFFSQLELDGNGVAGARISRVNSGIFQNCRFISRVLDGVETSLTHVLGDNTQVGTAIEITNSYHRVETGITSSVTLYDFGAASSNISGNKIEGYRLLNSAGVSVTEASASLLDRRYKNFVQDLNGVQKIASPTKFAHASYSSQAITSTLSTWIFNETVAPTGWTDYNTTTGELTAPHGGFYSFFVTFTCTSVPTNERFIVNLVKNGTISKSWYWDWPSGVGADRWSFDAADLLDVLEGDVIKIEVVNTTGTAALFGRAKLSIFCV